MKAVRPIVCLAKPQPKKKIKVRDVKHAIEHAKLICYTSECRVAWDTVEEISAAYNDQVVRDRDLELSHREYDL